MGDGQAVAAGEQLDGAGAEGREIGEHAREARRGGPAVGPRGRGGPRESGEGGGRGDPRPEEKREANFLIRQLNDYPQSQVAV